jgi:Peptidase family M28.
MAAARRSCWKLPRQLTKRKRSRPLDLYLVWYGSEEIGLLGSANFTAQHEEIIDKLAGMLNIDCLSRPVEGAPATLNFAYGSGSAPGDTNDPWANYLVARAEAAGIPVQQVYLPLASDNSSFAGYNVANLDLIYDSDSMMNDYNGVWFAGHLHDPYDETALVRQVQPQLEQMAQIALDTALIPENVELFRQKSGEQRRVLFISSHNEDVLLTPAALFDLGLAFEHAGMDVDTLPYGQALTASDLENVDLAIALPVFDLPESETPYDESWSDSEINVIKEYVNSGGTLILTNTAHRVKYYNTLYEENEDWADANALGKGFGITYLKPGTNTSNSSETTEDRLTKGVPVIYWYEGNGVPFSMVSGISLATAGGQTVLGRLEYGKGTVIAVADIGMLSAYPNELLNPQLVKNILDYTK